MLKFPVEGGTVTLQSSRVIPMECAMISGSSIQSPTTVAIGSTLTEKGRKELCSLLKQNLDIFAWKPADMTGVPQNIAKHPGGILTSQAKKKKEDMHQKEMKGNQEEIGRNLEVYVDDLVIKSHTEEEIIRDITETFKTLRQINMKLNPKKCIFGMQEGMFLGYKVCTNRLRACPDKADVVLSLPSPRCIKDVQKLNGKLASLNRNNPEDAKWKFGWKDMTLIRTRPQSKANKFGQTFIVERPEEIPPEQLIAEPKTNGLVERANRSLGEGIKARLDERSKDWIEELPHVLWAHRTMIKSSNGETPFSLTYGTEAVIPAEIGMPTLRTAEIDQAKNNEALGINLDLIEERRERAAIQEAKSKKKMEKYYNSRVRGTSFKPGEMVYRSNEASHAKDWSNTWTQVGGTHISKESAGKGSYKLKYRKGNEHAEDLEHL
ncbi:reverse transcriptase domain-containing protein [Tanacetum coccineum]